MFFGIRTTIGQEKIVADILRSKLKKEEEKITAIAVISGLKGYLIIEAPDESELRKLVYKVPHVRGVVAGEIKLDEIEHFFEVKPMTAGIERGDIVELTSGAFKGEKARVIRVDENKDKITVEIIEAAVPIPVTVDASAVRVIEKQVSEEPEKKEKKPKVEKEEKAEEGPEKSKEKKEEPAIELPKETLGITVKERKPKRKKEKEVEKVEEETKEETEVEEESKEEEQTEKKAVEEKAEETAEEKPAETTEERPEPEFLQPQETAEEAPKEEPAAEEPEEEETEEETPAEEEKKEEPEESTESEATAEEAEETESTESTETSESEEEKKEGE